MASSASAVAAGSVSKKIALVMGVANYRSIAWAVVESFLSKNYDCIVTHMNDDKMGSKVQKLVDNLHSVAAASNDNTTNTISQTDTETTEDSMNCGGSFEDSSSTTAQQQERRGRVLGCIPCNVQTDLPILFHEKIPHVLEDGNFDSNIYDRKLDAIVHSIAYGDLKPPPNSTSSKLLLTDATWESYQLSQHISAYSFLETAHYALETNRLASLSSLTALTYLGAVRAVPNYHLMGPAKAALEAMVRGMALDLGSISSTEDLSTYSKCIRVNAVSAGPLKTAAARGILNFNTLYQHAAERGPLRRNVTPREVAEAVTWIASPMASGITGQTIYVDGGYSTVVPVQAAVNDT